MPNSWQALITRSAISPLLAMRIRLNISEASGDYFALSAVSQSCDTPI
jgi:hypothetical protein